MKEKLQDCKIWKPISEHQVDIKEAKSLESYNYKNELATSMIFHVVLDEVLLMISNATSAKEA